MKKAIDKGSYVRVGSTNKDEFYTLEGLTTDGAKEFLESLGFASVKAAELSTVTIASPKKDLEADVIEIAKGVAYLKDSAGKFYLCETAALKPAKKTSDIKFLLMMNKERIEEYSTLQEIEARIKDLIGQRAADFNTQFRVYEISKIKDVRVDVGIFLG